MRLEKGVDGLGADAHAQLWRHAQRLVDAQQRQRRHRRQSRQRPRARARRREPRHRPRSRLTKAGPRRLHARLLRRHAGRPRHLEHLRPLAGPRRTSSRRCWRGRRHRSGRRRRRRRSSGAAGGLTGPKVGLHGQQVARALLLQSPPHPALFLLVHLCPRPVLVLAKAHQCRPFVLGRSRNDGGFNRSSGFYRSSDWSGSCVGRLALLCRGGKGGCGVRLVLPGMRVLLKVDRVASVALGPKRTVLQAAALGPRGRRGGSGRRSLHAELKEVGGQQSKALARLHCHGAVCLGHVAFLWRDERKGE